MVGKSSELQQGQGRREEERKGEHTTGQPNVLSGSLLQRKNSSSLGIGLLEDSNHRRLRKRETKKAKRVNVGGEGEGEEKSEGGRP